MHQLQSPDIEISHLLNFVSENDASDLHLKVGYPPFVRIGGHLRKVDSALVRIPESSHGIASRPSHQIAKVDNILAWFAKYRKE